jgi:uncharacterized protein
MKYRRFGRTEPEMLAISCGGTRYQFEWRDVNSNDLPRENQGKLEARIHCAVDLGMNHIETAKTPS